MRWPVRLLVAAGAAVVTLAVVALAGPNSAPDGSGKADPGPASATAATPARKVLYVANNWDGTAHIVDPRTFRKLDRFNVIPDKRAREREIALNPVRLAYFLAIRQFIGEGHDQYVDDMFSSPDGRFVYISRPSFADVVSIDLRTKRIVWRVPIDGQRSDHMAISPDGKRVLVSDSTERKVHVIDVTNPRQGRIETSFESGDSPHENNYSADGKKIFHASIGLVYTPLDRPAVDSTKGDRYFQIHDAEPPFTLRKRLDIGQLLADEGRRGYSSAVRPAAFTSDDKTAFLQLSFLHGFVEFDMENYKPLRIARLPLSEEARKTPREQYLLDSAHHGLSINPANEKLCAAATMSDYAAIVSRANFRSFKTVQVGRKPYWSTNSADGKVCFVSVSGDDRVSAISYATGRELAKISVGDHPQRMRIGTIRGGFLPGAGGGSGGTTDGGDSTCTRSGTGGNDTIRGTPGNDVICPGDGNDIVYGGGGDDRIEGGDGNDILYGEAGRDRLLAGSGADVLRGGPEHDSLDARDGRRGNDTVEGGRGPDECDADPEDRVSAC
jgi:DNA-binding beta-propeller fold protein YncE